MVFTVLILLILIIISIVNIQQYILMEKEKKTIPISKAKSSQYSGMSYAVLELRGGGMPGISLSLPVGIPGTGFSTTIPAGDDVYHPRHWSLKRKFKFWPFSISTFRKQSRLLFRDFVVVKYYSLIIVQNIITSFLPSCP